MAEKIAFIGFGEAGQAFASADLFPASSFAFDIKTDTVEAAEAKQEEYRKARVNGQATLGDAVEGASLIFSLVSADQSLKVAQQAAQRLQTSSIFLDMNSVAPMSKQAACVAVEASGARYVDVAIMSPVHPARLDVPLLLSGSNAKLAAARLSKCGFSNVRIVSDEVGQAAAIKMIRSVVVKGMEALTAEAMLAADALGVTAEVLWSLDESERPVSWTKRADYNLDRMMVHGLRRAEEMVEAAKTLEDAGVEPLMTRGTVQRQREIGTLGYYQPLPGVEDKLKQITATKAGSE